MKSTWCRAWFLVLAVLGEVDALPAAAVSLMVVSSISLSDTLWCDPIVVTLSIRHIYTVLINEAAWVQCYYALQRARYYTWILRVLRLRPAHMNTMYPPLGSTLLDARRSEYAAGNMFTQVIIQPNSVIKQLPVLSSSCIVRAHKSSLFSFLLVVPKPG